MDECEEKTIERNRRGYYSETVTDLKRENDSDLEEDTQKQAALTRRKLKWQIMTVEHSPFVKDLEPPKTSCLLAPAERWMTYEKEKRIVSIRSYMIYV